MNFNQFKIYVTAVLTMVCTVSLAQTARSFDLVNSTDGKSKIHAFLPENPSGRAVVVLPGGGYTHLAVGHEGTDWAPWFNERGIACFVVEYRMPKGDRNIPLTDACNAMRTVRDSASLWSINPHDVGMMGSSAGGHLASAVSTHARLTERPDFTILLYPVISMDEKNSHKGSCVGFLGEGRNDKGLVREWSSDHAVRRHLTPRSIILLANDDGVVPPVTNGIAYYSAQRRAGNECALSVYPSGGHGFGFNPSFHFHNQMLSDLDNWLSSFKAPAENAVRVACIGNSITDGSGIDMADQYGYPAQLQRLLGQGYWVRNYGVGARTMLQSGDHPYMKEQAWRDAQDFSPNIVVIKLGTNDSKEYNWRGADAFSADMQLMLDTLKQLPTKPRIIICSPIPAASTWTINDSVIVNGEMPALRRLAKKNHAEFLDLHSLFTDTDHKQMQRDGIHPTRQGAGQMARLIADCIGKK